MITHWTLMNQSHLPCCAEPKEFTVAPKAAMTSAAPWIGMQMEQFSCMELWFSAGFYYWRGCKAIPMRTFNSLQSWTWDTKSGCCSAENWWSCVQEGGEGHPTAAAHLTPNSKFHSVQTLQLSSPSFDTWVRSEAAEHPPAGTRVTLAAPTGAGQSPHRAVMSWMLLECSFIRPKTLSRQESCGRPRYRVLSSKTIWKLLLI